ncbi:MAG: hypothetical protein V3T72_22685, partial [Thermoanaerobaculia bacterium]
MKGNVRGIAGRTKSSRALRAAVRFHACEVAFRMQALALAKPELMARRSSERFPPGPLPGGRTPAG